MNKDRSLLFGMLAVSMKKVAPDRLSAVARRAEQDPGFDLAKSLVDEGLITEGDKAQIDSLLELSLAEHEGDAARTLQAFGKDPNKIETLLESMDGFEAFERYSDRPAPSGDTSAGFADSILGNVQEPDSFGDGGPLELDSLVEDGDPAKTRVTQSGNTGDKASIGDIALGDAPDSFFQSIANTDTQIMSPVQAAAEIDESQIVPAVAEHPGRYEMIRDFAKGGMGKITLVHDTHLGRDIALKQLLQRNILPETRPGAPTTAILTIPIIARFLQEARVTGQLEHPSIIPVYELGYREDGSLYYTMKLIRGQSMHDVLKDCKDIRDRMKMLPHFLDLCQAISYAHSRGVIHRDLKPMNIMIGEFGETVVIDWGIAKVKGQDDIHAKGLQETVQAMRVSSAEATAKTMYGQTIGSPYFMPAEQAMGRTDLIDERSDIYSLGAVLYVILTGQMPYQGNNVREFMGKVGQIEPKPVLELEPSAPRELAAVVKRAMALVPENRYQSARELTTEIEAFISGGMVSAYDYSLTEMIKRFYKKNKKVINTAAAAALILLGSGVFYSISLKIARDRAVVAEAEAREAQGEAETQRDRAVAAEADALAAEAEARRELYRANIANAKFNINEQQMAKARELLASCEPESLRAWEWGFLAAETHADLLTVDRGGRFSGMAPGGAGLVTGTVRGTLTLHDMNTGEILHEFIHRAGYNYAVAGSDDMARVAVLEDAAIHVWDVQTREELLRAEMPERKLTKYLMAISGNGKYVAGLGGDFVLRVWDVDTGEVAVEVEDCQPSGFNVFLSPDGSRMMVARRYLGEEGFDQRFEVFSVPAGEVLGTEIFAADSALSAQAAAFSPDGSMLAVGTDNNLQIWAVDGFKKRHEIAGQRFGHLDEIAFSPDGNHVAAGTKDGNLLVFDVKAGKTAAVLPKAHEDWIRSVRFSRDGSRVASVADDRTLRLWTVPGLRPLRTYKGHDSSVYTLGFSQDGTRVATSTPSGKSKVWDISADLEFAPAELDKFARVTFDRASGFVAGGAQDTVILWDARSGHRVRELAAPGEPAKAIAFNPAGTLVIAVVWNGEAEMLHAWDVATGEEQFSFGTGQTRTQAVHAINGDTAILVYTGSDLIRFETGGGDGVSVLADLAAMEGKTLGSYALSEDGSRLAAGLRGEDSVATALHLPLDGSGEPASIDIAQVSSVSPHFTPDAGRILICQADRPDKLVEGGSVSYWNLSDNTRTEPVRRHENEIVSARFSRDGSLLATGDRNGVTAIWAADSLRPAAVMRGHAGAVSHLDFSPNGERLVTGSADRSFKIWDTAAGVQILTLNDAAVGADVQVALPEQVAFSEDGLQLATITSPPVSPMILHAFSTSTADYPEAADEGGEAADEAAGDVDEETAAFKQFERRMEAYKRLYWRHE